jgi:hypothetical protein
MEPFNWDHDGVGSVTEFVAGLDGLAESLDGVELLLGDDEGVEDTVKRACLQFLEPWAVIAVPLCGVVSPSSGNAADPLEKGCANSVRKGLTWRSCTARAGRRKPGK